MGLCGHRRSYLLLTLTGAKQAFGQKTDIKSLPNKQRSYSGKANESHFTMKRYSDISWWFYMTAGVLFNTLNDMIKTLIHTQHTFKICDPLVLKHHFTSRLKRSGEVKMLISI